ncbi:MAG: hypothetical protein WBM50_23440, partial [Acidimicrobiales bacterium]
MPPGLSELLERIRPAGTPGAPSEGEQQREEFDRVNEIAELAAVLEAFEEEADAMTSAATEQAAAVRRDADRQARQIRAGVPDRIATVQAAATRAHDERDQAMRDSVGVETTAEVTRLETRAATLIPSLRDAALHTI